MGWNFRILAHESHEEVYLQIYEVYYNENGIPNAHSENPTSVGSNIINGIKYDLNKMLECTKKPILWKGDRFPNECIITYSCKSCGRVMFGKPLPHICNGRYRKHKLQWVLNYQ